MVGWTSTQVLGTGGAIDGPRGLDAEGQAGNQGVAEQQSEDGTE